MMMYSAKTAATHLPPLALALAALLALPSCSSSALPRREDLQIGKLKGDYILRDDLLCADRKSVRSIYVDIDHTAVKGDFIAGAKPLDEAIDALNDLDQTYGIAYVSANFKGEEINEFLKANRYPVAPLFTRPLPFLPNFEEWCMQGEDFYVCDYVHKIGVLSYIKGACPPQKRLVGIGDRFADYAAYRESGVCPIMIPHPRQEKILAQYGPACDPVPRSGYFFYDLDNYRTRRCPIIPEKHIVPWNRVFETAKRYLEGKVECGEW